MNEARDKWNARYASGDGPTGEPSSFLVGLADRLPSRGRVLDVAGGAGRNAVWLAALGLDVTVADISDIGLGLARQRAAAEGVKLTAVAVDLERSPLPRGPWDLVVVIGFLQRRLFRLYPEVLAPGGLLVAVQATLTNLTRNARPPRHSLIEAGELRSLAADLDVLSYDECWSAEGRHEARLLARRCGSTS